MVCNIQYAQEDWRLSLGPTMSTDIVQATLWGYVLVVKVREVIHQPRVLLSFGHCTFVIWTLYDRAPR
jgi:hypothetical protein